MNRMYGADIEQLRHLAAEFDRAAARLEQDRSLVSRWIQLPAWLGPDAQRFRNLWDSEHSQVLNAVVVRLREVASELHRNTTEQQDASVADGSGRSTSEKHWSHVGTGVINPRPDPYGFLKRSENLLKRWDAMSDAEKRALDPNHLIHTYGSLDGLPARVRDEANRIALEAFMLSPCPAEPPEAIADYQRKMTAYSQIVQTLEQHPDAQLLVLEPSSGTNVHVAISLGDVDTADNVTMYVQGWTSAADKEQGLLNPINEMSHLRNQVVAESGRSSENFATVVWMDYDAPQDTSSLQDLADKPSKQLDEVTGVPVFSRPNPGNLMRGVSWIESLGNAKMTEYAEVGSTQLAAFANGIRSNNPNAKLVGMGHSYGSLVTGKAMQKTDAFNSFISVGAPGIGVENISDLQISGDVIVAGFTDDPIYRSRAHGGIPKGDDVIHIHEGAHGNPFTSHSSYFKPGSNMQKAIASQIAKHSGIWLGKDSELPQF